MTTYITWKDYYSVGDSSLDAQHKEIIKLINKLYAAMEEAAERRAAKQILDRLSRYTAGHFRYEEGVMREMGYPDRQAHAAEHEQMRQRTADLRPRLGLVTAREVLQLLKGWWLGHIQGEDKKYTPYLRTAVAPRLLGQPRDTMNPRHLGKLPHRAHRAAAKPAGGRGHS